MAADTKIEWCDHSALIKCWLRITPQHRLVGKIVTAFAQSYAVPNVEPEIGICRERPDMMSVQIPATIVAAVTASKSVAQKYIIAPSLQFMRRAKSLPFNSPAINIPWRQRAARCPFSCLLADFGPRFWTVFFPKAVTDPCFRGGAHLGAALWRHLFSLHWWNEVCAALQPSLAHNVASRGSHHG